MSTKDDALIEKMNDVFFDAVEQSADYETAMRRALAVARKQILEEAALAVDDRERELSALIERGKGEHGKPGYVVDATWNSWLGQRVAYENASRVIRSLHPGAAQ
ncbi:MAG: hypothetical protein WC026_15680 [Hyphomicrobium sp.]|uniref:hypothetical protein n=1 Tax=Hyphomicrobium sp. TaxID=82 RepID=UPI00356ADC21